MMRFRRSRCAAEPTSSLLSVLIPLPRLFGDRELSPDMLDEFGLFAMDPCPAPQYLTQLLQDTGPVTQQQMGRLADKLKHVLPSSSDSRSYCPVPEAWRSAVPIAISQEQRDLTDAVRDWALRAEPRVTLRENESVPRDNAAL